MSQNNLPLAIEIIQIDLAKMSILDIFFRLLLRTPTMAAIVSALPVFHFGSVVVRMGNASLPVI